MDTKNQFTIFCICIAVGLLGGILYEPFAFLRMIFGCPRGKSRPVGIALDIAFFAAFTVCTVFAGYLFRFPDFRVYMWIGYALGGIIYLKSLHRIVAFFGNVCYNKITKLAKKARKREKTLKKEVEKRV